MPARDERRESHRASEFEECFEGLITKGALVPAGKARAKSTEIDSQVNPLRIYFTSVNTYL